MGHLLQKAILIKINGFINRIFTTEEIEQSKKTRNKINFFAKRFAAKEAFVKALGTGFSKNINFNDIGVINNKRGKPSININKKIKNIIRRDLKIKKFLIYLSLSDEKNYSIAFVIINKIK